MSTYINTLLNTAGGDFARQTKFRAYFAIPDSLQGIVDEKNLDLLCKNFTIPMRKMELVDYKYRGKTVPIMGAVTFDHNISVTFILDDGHKIRRLFENWIVALDNTSTADEGANDTVVAYKDEVPNPYDRTSDIGIAPLNWQEDIELTKYVFSQAFPVSIGDIQYSTDSQSSVQELTVEFAFLFYKNEEADSDLLSNITDGINNAIGDAKSFLSKGAQSLLGGEEETKKKQKNKINDNPSTVPPKDINEQKSFFDQFKPPPPPADGIGVEHPLYHCKRSGGQGSDCDEYTAETGHEW